MLSPHPPEESSSFQMSFNSGIETFLKKTLCWESIPSFLTVYISKSRSICCRNALCLQNMLARKEASINNFLLLWGSKREGCPRTHSKLAFWALELHDPQGKEDDLFWNQMEVWAIRSFVRQRKNGVCAKAAKHANPLWHRFLGFRVFFWMSSEELKFPPRISVSSGYHE